MTTDTVLDRLDQARRGVGVSGRGPGTPRGRAKSPLGRAAVTLVLFAVPSLILLLLLNLFPVIYSFLQSLKAAPPSTPPREAPFAGFANYVSVLPSPVFIQRAIF